MSLNDLAAKIRACQKCKNKLSQYDVVPRPIFSGGSGFPVMLIGQAPGKTEYKNNAPFQGSAGESIRELFRTFGVNDFENTVYQTSVTKCYPGRRVKDTTDRMPSMQEVRNCMPFLVKQLELLQPKLVVCLGSLSWKAYVEMREKAETGYCQREFSKQKNQDLRIPDLVGKRFVWEQKVFLPMIHPAGSANGARAMYPDQDVRSKRLLRKEIELLKKIHKLGIDHAQKNG